MKKIRISRYHKVGAMTFQPQELVMFEGTEDEYGEVIDAFKLGKEITQLDGVVRAPLLAQYLEDSGDGPSVSFSNPNHMVPLFYYRKVEVDPERVEQ